MSPKRVHKKIETFKSDLVQGKGSWVKIQTPTYEDIDEVIANVDDDSAKTKMELSKALIDKLTLEWNWVDDDDIPLPQPQEDSDVIKRLPIQETLFLIGCVQMDETDQKKSPRK